MEKLYLVTIRGGFSITSTNYHESYVIANNPDEAYKKVKKTLDEKDICFADERELESIKLIADSYEYPDCKTLLFL